MDIGDRVKVNAPGHYHDDMEGEIYALAEGDMPHIEVDDEARKRLDVAGQRVAQHFTNFGEAKKAFKKNKKSTHLIQGSAGVMFADVAFGNQGTGRYPLEQLESV
jgi:hypothetical protein